MKHPVKRLTPEQRNELLDWLRGGGDRASVCDVVGVSQVQLRFEMKRDPEFAQAFARAEASMELRQMNKVIEATKDEKNWRTSVWWIERRTRERLRGESRSLSAANVYDLVDALARAVGEELPEGELLRRVMERLYDVVALDASAPSPLSLPAPEPLGDEPSSDESAFGASIDPASTANLPTSPPTESLP